MRSRRVGRGGKRGKTSGRGTKGQKARAGHRIRPDMRDTIKKIPKLRGHGKNRARTVNSSVQASRVVNLGALERHYQAGDAVNPASLERQGLIRSVKGSRVPVKILGTGTLSKKLVVTKCHVSESARKHIEAAGGTIDA